MGEQGLSLSTSGATAELCYKCERFNKAVTAWKHGLCKKHLKKTRRLPLRSPDPLIICEGRTGSGRPCGNEIIPGSKRTYQETYCCQKHYDYRNRTPELIKKKKPRKRRKKRKPRIPRLAVSQAYNVPLGSTVYQKRKLPYPEYLETKHWKQVRKAALKAIGHKCQLCGKKKRLNVHHNNYQCLWKETLRDVVILCRDCHKIFHGILDEKSGGLE